MSNPRASPQYPRLEEGQSSNTNTEEEEEDFETDYNWLIRRITSNSFGDELLEEVFGATESQSATAHLI